MPKHQIDVYSSINGRIDFDSRHATVELPIDTDTEGLVIASTVAKSVVGQMLGKLGVNHELDTVYCEAPTSEEMRADIEASGGRLLTTDEVLSS